MVDGIIDNNDNKYLKISENIRNGYALHKIIFDRDGNPIDFIYFNVNDSYEKLTGIKKKDIIGKRFTEVFIDLIEDEFDYVGEYGRISLYGGNLTREVYSKALEKWYSVSVYSEEYGFFSTVFHDITETKNLISELHRVNYLNAILLDSIPHPALLVNKHRKVIAANKLAKELGALVGGFCWRDFGQCRYLSEEDKKHIESDDNTYDNKAIACNFCEANNALSKNKSVNTEIKLADKYCHIFWIPTQEEDVYLHYSIDITERKEIERSLKENELRLRQIAEASFEGICIHDKGIVLDCNKRMEEIYGYKTNELIGMALSNIIITEPTKKEKNNNKTEKTVSGSHFGIRKNGTVFDIEILARKVQYNGVDAEVLGVRDISETQNTEEIIKKINTALRDAQHIAHIGNIEVDICNKSMYWSDEVFCVFGYKPQAFIPDYSYFDKHILAEDRKLIQHKIKERTPFDSTFTIESRFKKLDGEMCWLNIKGDIEFEDQDCKPNRIFIIVQDITDKKQAELARRANEENVRLLQETLEMDRLKTEFFANVSHELRTPLNIIFSTLQLFELYMRNGPVDDVEIKIGKGIKNMKQNSYRLLRLINNIIDVTKIDGGFISLQLDNSDIVSVIRRICLSVAEYMENKSINFTFSTDIEEKVIACDLDKIETIILNLISNAIKFNKPQGNVTVNIHNERENILISVEDTGVGIPVEKQEMVFERFMQVDKSLTRNHEGSGIGLSLVKHFVEMHGGQIWVESEYGKGSKFIFRLPNRILEPKDMNSINNSSPEKNYNNHIERIKIEFSDIYS